MTQDVGLHAAMVQPVVDNAPMLTAWVALFFGLQLFLDHGVPALAPGFHAWLVQASTKETYAELRTRAMGTAFALYASVLAGYVLLFDCPDPHDLYAVHPLVHTWVVGAAVGFFTWDVFMCLTEGWGAAFLMHGVAVLSVYLAGLYGFVPFMACVCVLYEASTPFLHARKVMITLGWAKTHPVVFGHLTTAFGLVFFLARIVVGLATSISWWTDMLTHLEDGTYHSFPVFIMYLVCNVLLSGLNIWWFSQMVGVMLASNNAKAVAALDAKTK